jgi:hypothetical protein
LEIDGKETFMIERVLYMLVAAAAGFIGGGAYFTNTFSDALFQQGVKEGRKLVDWKEVALSDRGVTNNICNAWWFEADHRDRRLKK